VRVRAVQWKLHHIGIAAKDFAMTQHATIAGHVTYTPGDGAPLTIRKAPWSWSLPKTAPP